MMGLTATAARTDSAAIDRARESAVECIAYIKAER